jgi:hypothetical protein
LKDVFGIFALKATTIGTVAKVAVRMPYTAKIIESAVCKESVPDSKLAPTN